MPSEKTKYDWKSTVEEQKAYARKRKQAIEDKANKAVASKGGYTFSAEESRKRGSYSRVLEGKPHGTPMKRKTSNGGSGNSGFGSLVEGLKMIRDMVRKTGEGFTTLHKMGE